MTASYLEKLRRFLPLLFDIQALKAVIFWPKFSITAYRIATDLFKQGIHPQTLIDVGANVGQFTVAALNTFKDVRVYAFEPIDTSADRLRKNTLKYSSVQIYTLALGATVKKNHFYVNSYSLASSMLKISERHKTEFPHAKVQTSATVDVIPLDQLRSDMVLKSPVLMKIDVQGYEGEVLEGGKETLKKVDYVLLETSFTQMYEGEPLFAELVETMKSFHFDFVRPIAFLKSNKTGEILQADILFRKSL